MADTSATLLLRTEPIGKLLLRYSLPAIAAMVVFSLYTIIDSIFIGHGVGPLAISGLAITFPVMNLTFALVLLVGIGGDLTGPVGHHVHQLIAAGHLLEQIFHCGIEHHTKVTLLL